MPDTTGAITLIEALEAAGLDPDCTQYFIIAERADMSDVKQSRNAFVYRGDDTMMLDTLSAAIRSLGRRIQYHVCVRILGTLLSDMDPEQAPEPKEPKVPKITLDS